MKILICGFTGAGKSTFLKKFEGNTLGFDCVDLDHALSLDLGLHPDRLGEWILQNGFPLFRDKEKTKLGELLRHPQSLVIALGGGTLTDDVVRLIKETPGCKMVFLDTPYEICHQRILNDRNRPLSNLPEAELKKLYETRREVSRKLADLTLSPENTKEIVTLSSLVHNLG
jgi:shikimate kinase